MRFRFMMLLFCQLLLFTVYTLHCHAETPVTDLEKAMSDTLDTWREGRYEQLYERLAHRSKTSKEVFVEKMKAAGTHPACCFQKMEGFKVLNEKRTEATVYVKIGLEGTPGAADSCTREFKLTHEAGEWKMQLQDVLALGGVSGKKAKHTAKKHKKTTSSYHN